MKNFLYNYYEVYVDEIKKVDENYYFVYNDNKYMLSLVRDKIEFEEIYKYLKQMDIEYFKIVYNKNGELTSSINNKIYTLLSLTGILDYEYKLADFKYYYVRIKDGLDWGKLWANRLDYYEIQVRELGLKYQTLINSYGLFSGLAENAILYYNLTKNKFDEYSFVSIVHKRIKYPCLAVDYLNPTNLVIDYSIRDLAEYIKSFIASDDYNITTVIDAVSKINFNKLMFNLFYSRLLYPSIYFDKFDDIILGVKKDEDIIEDTNIYVKYIDMLKNLYDYFYIKYDMFKIEWLEKIKM